MNFHIVSQTPEGDLLDYIKETYRLSFKDEKKDQYRIVIDDGCYDFVFFKEGDSLLKYGNNLIAPIKEKVFTIHQLTPPYQLNFGNQLTFFTAKVQPWWNRSFFDNKGKKGIIDLFDNYGQEIIELHENLFKTQDFNSQNELFKKFIENYKPDDSEDVYMVKKICLEIYKHKGDISVNQLSDKFSMNRQDLNTLFKKEVLYTLKKFITIVRVVETIRFKIKNPELRLTDLALQSGYFDQAHFNNDFKRACGTSPSKLFKNLPEFLYRHQ